MLLKNCESGEKAVYNTHLTVTRNEKTVSFKFVCENSKLFCAHKGYNKFHCDGDVCEIFIGSDNERKSYYEIELSPANDLLLGKITFSGWNAEENKPILELKYVDDCFVKSTVKPIENGYEATITINTDDVKTGEGKIFFNAFRIETDGGETEKHLFALSPTMRRKFHVPEKFVYLDDLVD